MSLLLGNIMLHECDRELERRGHRFVRYADDLMVFCKSRKAAERTLSHLIPFIEGKLFLKVNRKKTKVAHVRKVKFLGYGFYRYAGKGRLRTHERSVEKLKAKLREVTGRSNGRGIEARKKRLNDIIRGWVEYFRLADMKKLLAELDPWLRRRLRMVAWKRYWRTAGSPILAQAMSNEKLKSAGYLTLTGCYRKARCKIQEPPYTERYVRWCERSPGPLRRRKGMTCSFPEKKGRCSHSFRGFIEQVISFQVLRAGLLPDLFFTLCGSGNDAM